MPKPIQDTQSGETGSDWTQEEVELVVADYFDMLQQELAGVLFNKARHNRDLRDNLPARSKGSIEFKHQNISAVLSELGLPFVQGYKPRSNYQLMLRDAVEEYLACHNFASSRLEKAKGA